MDRDAALRLLRSDVESARQKLREASAVFDAIVSEIPSGLPHPDGSQRIFNSSRELTMARRNVMAALDRLNALVLRNTMPDDLKGR